MISCTGDRNAAISAEDLFEFKLIDGLGSVSLAYPPRTDTFFSWIQRSDCGRPCEQGDYRFQLRQSRIYKESGFYWVGEPIDSVDQLTVYHLRPDSLFRDHDSSIIGMRDFLLQKISNRGIENILSDSLVKFGRRYFRLFAVENYDSVTKIYDKRLIAYTTVSGWELEFHYKLLSRSKDSILSNFFNRSIENLATVRIKDGG